MDARLAERLTASSALNPRWTLAKATAYVIAIAVHACAFALVAAGVALLVTGFPDYLSILLGAAALAFAVLIRPRLGRASSDGMLERGDAPALYSLADEVARALETQRVDRILVDSEFNAYLSVAGLRRTRALGLGLPLILILRPDELVALVAHELAHARNGDATRGLVVGSAINTLAEIYNALEGSGRSMVQSDEFAFVEVVSRPLLWLLARPVLGLLYTELLLLRQDSQRAEYLADALAAEVAGTAAVVELQQDLLNGPTGASVIQRAARDDTADLFDLLRHAVDSVPERERERRRRVARLEGARLTATHPPTGRRLDLLERRGMKTPEVKLDDARAAEIHAELVEPRQRLTAQLIDDHRASLY